MCIVFPLSECASLWSGRHRCCDSCLQGRRDPRAHPPSPQAEAGHLCARQPRRQQRDPAQGGRSRLPGAVCRRRAAALAYHGRTGGGLPGRRGATRRPGALGSRPRFPICKLRGQGSSQNSPRFAPSEDAPSHRPLRNVELTTYTVGSLATADCWGAIDGWMDGCVQATDGLCFFTTAAARPRMQDVLSPAQTPGGAPRVGVPPSEPNAEGREEVVSPAMALSGPLQRLTDLDRRTGEEISTPF